MLLVWFNNTNVKNKLLQTASLLSLVCATFEKRVAACCREHLAVLVTITEDQVDTTVATVVIYACYVLYLYLLASCFLYMYSLLYSVYTRQLESGFNSDQSC